METKTSIFALPNGETFTYKAKAWDEILDDLLKSVACKAAVKAGMDTSVQELQAFAQTVLDDDSIRNCPHGRPCVTYLSRYQLEKLFKRVL